MMRRSILVCILLSGAGAVVGQVDFSSQYANAKSLFKDGKYNLAMESFKSLIPHDDKNPYSAYASFYYALAAYQQGYRAVAKDMLNQIRAVHAGWDQMNEVNFWLGKVHFDNGDFFQGLKVFQGITDKKFEKDIESVKSSYIPSIADVETLTMMHEEYPADATIGKTLAIALSKNTGDDQSRSQLEQLIDKFKLRRTDFFPEAPTTVHKQKYAVSVMLPFMVAALEPTPSRKRNQVVLDFYEGMKLALDTLARQGIIISLRAYDTERSVEKINKILDTEELKNTDLIVGPLFPEENKVVQEFSAVNRINVIHPFSNSSDIIGLNPHAYLYQPSSETIGRKAAAFLADRAKDKICMVIYGPGKQDSVVAANFSREAIAKGFNIVHAERFDGKDAGKITEILATPTEFDEFKYPTEFTLKKDSIDCILVAADDPLIYTKVVSGVETRGDSIIVVGTENWIEDNAIELEKYQALRLTVAAPNYMNMYSPQYNAFQRRFLETHGRQASSVARIGYEFLLFVGHQLKTNGVYFQEGLNNSGTLPGYMSEGFQFGPDRNNQVVPFIGIRQGQLTLLGKY